MKSSVIRVSGVALGGLVLLASCFVSSCGSAKGKIDESAAAPPPLQVVEQQPDLNVIKVDHPERFKLVAASGKEEQPQLHATGSVNPDIEKSVPVVSLASGRVVGIFAKLGDDVKKGQLLLKVQSNDVNNAFQTYEQAKADLQLAKTQLDRAKLLYDKGAISLNDLQVAEDTEVKARVSVTAAEHQIQTLGAELGRYNPVINVYAPASGTIVEQNIFSSASVHTPDNQPNLFTIADLSRVWVICDVYENDLPSIKLGDSADIELNAYPGRTFRGRISNIGKVLDPTIRSAKVRIELPNPGMMRSGMFVTAIFHGMHGQTHAIVPSNAVLHLHDRDWVFLPAANGQFRRTEVTGGRIEDGQQVIMAGLAPGQQIVRDALALNAESGQ